MNLNERAWWIYERLLNDCRRFRIASEFRGATRILDCGVAQAGGLETGCRVAEVCLAGLGNVRIVPTPDGPAVAITTDDPVSACLASQYAGWPIQAEKYFAMASGPMRVLRGREPLLKELQIVETSSRAIGVLESRKMPSPQVCEQMASECGVAPADLTLLIAPTASLVGTVQVVARSVETAMHKMHALGFDMTKVVSGWGVAPLPPVAADDLQGIGRTNDAVLYGGEVTLWVREDDDRLRTLGPQVPSEASRDFGRPFAEIFAACGHDFYRIDPHLFSPAVVTFINLTSGRSWRFGQRRPDVLKESFGCESAS